MRAVSAPSRCRIIQFTRCYRGYSSRYSHSSQAASRRQQSALRVADIESLVSRQFLLTTRVEMLQTVLHLVILLKSGKTCTELKCRLGQSAAIFRVGEKLRLIWEPVGDRPNTFVSLFTKKTHTWNSIGRCIAHRAHYLQRVFSFRIIISKFSRFQTRANSRCTEQSATIRGILTIFTIRQAAKFSVKLITSQWAGKVDENSRCNRGIAAAFPYCYRARVPSNTD